MPSQDKAERYRSNLRDELDSAALYREGAASGRVMHIAVHPYLTGMPYRIGALDAALKYICKHKKVWKATGSEIASHYLSSGRSR